MKKQDCPCRSGKAYPDCCRPYLTGKALPNTPETLMRSRYTAFHNKDADYLIATLAPEKRNTPARVETLGRDLAATMAGTRWLGLRVMASGLEPETGPVREHGFVEFAAFFEQKGALGQLHERSVFIREAGNWYYRDGKILGPVPLSRNQPCVCGSGLKFKRCHGKN